MHNDCRSDAYTDQLSLSIDAEELTLGNTCASDSCQDQDQEAKSCQSRDQIEPFTSVPRTAKNASRPLHGGGRTGGQALGQQNDSLSHIRAELRVKIEELAAAEATVSKLRDEIKLLEEKIVTLDAKLAELQKAKSADSTRSATLPSTRRSPNH